MQSSNAERVSRASLLLGLVVLAALIAMVGLTAAKSFGRTRLFAGVQRTDAPTFGRPPWGGVGEMGFGEVRPRTIFNGGTASSLWSDLKWESWGAPVAFGHGVGAYFPPNPTSGADYKREPGVIVAFDLGQCSGRLMYRASSWYFPQHGEKADIRLETSADICTGDYYRLGDYLTVPAVRE